MPQAQYGVVLVTAPSQDTAVSIAHTLVTEGLAACVSLMPMTSIYTWQDQVHQEQEWQLLIKTNLQCFDQLEARVRSIHPYEVPEVIALPIITGAQPYLQWIAEAVQPVQRHQSGES